MRAYETSDPERKDSQRNEKKEEQIGSQGRRAGPSGKKKRKKKNNLHEMVKSNMPRELLTNIQIMHLFFTSRANKIKKISKV